MPKWAAWMLFAGFSLFMVCGTVSGILKSEPVGQRELRLVSPSGQFSIHLMATDDGAFVFVNGPKGRDVVLGSARHSESAYVGVGEPGNNGHPLAFATSDSGPVIQVSDKSGVRLLDANAAFKGK